ncbi:MAG: helix-turn-helix domain-containing protein [Aestuariivirga sp.]
MQGLSYAGIPAAEVIAFAEIMNALELQHVEMFGDSINSAIVTNVKAADLKQQPVSVRGLARVIGLQPSTIRRRIAYLVEQGWLTQDETGVLSAVRTRAWSTKSPCGTSPICLCVEQIGVGRFSPTLLMPETISHVIRPPPQR